ncbi:hypothetical protein [Roseomonas rosulenta]|uniref:hypothetical protein n=1 Tax=Roseomonas rosulenta TaxID=2748667 RepID=UPI0018E01AC8|nr:hypothetical protein [Roseomonas rosulenta]
MTIANIHTEPHLLLTKEEELIAKFYTLARAGRLHSPKVTDHGLLFDVVDVEQDFEVAMNEGAIAPQAFVVAQAEAVLGYQVDTETTRCLLESRIHIARPKHPGLNLPGGSPEF